MQKIIQIIVIILFSIIGFQLIKIILPQTFLCNNSEFSDYCSWPFFSTQLILQENMSILFNFGPEEIIFIFMNCFFIFLFKKSKYKIIEFACSIYFGILISIITNGFTDHSIYIPDEIFQFIIPIIVTVVLYYEYNYESSKLKNKLRKKINIFK